MGLIIHQVTIPVQIQHNVTFLLGIDKITVIVQHLIRITAAPLLINGGVANLIHTQTMGVTHYERIELYALIAEPIHGLLCSFHRATLEGSRMHKQYIAIL